MNEPELELLRRYREAYPAPPVDVVQKVRQTIAGLPERSRRANRRMMVACATVCATTAAMLAGVAVVWPGDVSESPDIVELVLDAHCAEVRSFLD